MIDVAKFVGAASAPVALIIATSIFLSNLSTKWWSMSGMFRALADEYRKTEERYGARPENVKRQLALYDRRLRLLMRATLLLTLAIISFILTVLCTGLTMLFDSVDAFKYATIACSFGGLLLLGSSVIAELIENNLGKRVLRLEMDDFPELSTAAEQMQNAR